MEIVEIHEWIGDNKILEINLVCLHRPTVESFERRLDRRMQEFHSSVGKKRDNSAVVHLIRNRSQSIFPP